MARNLQDAIKQMYKFGECVKLDEWGGFWFVDEDGLITVITKDNEITKTPYFDKYADRTDWLTCGNKTDRRNAERIKEAKNKARIGRMFAEYGELEIRLFKLKDFIVSENFAELSEDEKYLIEKQKDVMSEYLDVLEKRLGKEGYDPHCLCAG